MKEKVKLDALYYDFGNNLITSFERIASNNVNDNFDISADSMTNGYISGNGICISYIAINENEKFYVYNDSEGMICFNTGSLDKTFTKVGKCTYFGYEQLEDEPFGYISKINKKLNEYSSVKKALNNITFRTLISISFNHFFIDVI